MGRDRRSDVDIVEEVVLCVEAALALARDAADAREDLGAQAERRLADIHAGLLRDGFRGKPEGVLF